MGLAAQLPLLYHTTQLLSAVSVHAVTSEVITALFHT